MSAPTFLSGLVCVILSAALGYCLGFNSGLSPTSDTRYVESIGLGIIILWAVAAEVGWVLLGYSVWSSSKSLPKAVTAAVLTGGFTLVAAFFVGNLVGTALTMPLIGPAE